MDKRFISAIINVDGMTCSSCEMRIENALKKTEGVKNVKANRSIATVYVVYDEDVIKLNKLEQIIEKCGYTVRTEKNKRKNSDTFSINHMLGIGVIILAIYVIIKNTIGFDFLPQINQSMGYGILFVVGLLTSLHCIAMCGGINLSQCVGHGSNSSESGLAKIKPSFLYNLGRVISYTIIGGIVGALGSVVSFSGSMKGTVAILAGAFMVIMGLNMLNIAPWTRKLLPKMPHSVANKVFEGKTGKGPFYVGLLNGLMPCGPLQSMQLYALGTGSFVAGVMSMFVFSLGTVPLMFGFGALSTLLSRKFTNRMLKFSAMLVMVLGFIMISRGLSLSGVSTVFADTNIEKAAQSGSVAKINGDVQEVTIDLQRNYYDPIIVQKGIKVRFNIKATAENLNGCNGSIQIPKFDIQKKLEPGDNIIEFTPTEEGTYVYSCWMGMITSKITVVSDISKITGEDIIEANKGVTSNNAPPCCQ